MLKKYISHFHSIDVVTAVVAVAISFYTRIAILAHEPSWQLTLAIGAAIVLGFHYRSIGPKDSFGPTFQPRSQMIVMITYIISLVMAVLTTSGFLTVMFASALYVAMSIGILFAMIVGAFLSDVRRTIMTC